MRRKEVCLLSKLDQHLHLSDQPTNLRGEVAVKYYEAIQTSLPMCWLAAIGGTFKYLLTSYQRDVNSFFYRLNKQRRNRLIEKDLPKVVDAAKKSVFFMNIYFEEHFEQDLNDLRKEMLFT